MAEQILFNIAESLLKSLGSTALTEVASSWALKADLEKLKNTITMIKDFFLDAEERQLQSHAVRDWLERLSATFYAADDLFDELATFASRRGVLQGNKLSKEVRLFFSDSNQIIFALKMLKIKKIWQGLDVKREELDHIVDDGFRFGFMLRPREEGVGLVRMQRDLTHSYIDTQEVIGRKHDKQALLDIFLTSKKSSGSEEKRLLVVPIVGIGGVGKTTLAKFIYNDHRVVEQFELRLWVCVSDDFDVKDIVKKILMSVKDAEIQNLEMDQLQGQLRKEIGGRRYLLVLDDVWIENPQEWHMLSDILRVGREGSKVLVTTRSQAVVRIMGTAHVHKLEGLSEEKSWALFEKMAFGPEEAQQKPRLVELGKNIIKKCCGVPLAIRTLGITLCGQDERKWLNVEATILGELTEHSIMPILKLCYNHLYSPLKNCFGYCALFPKDHLLQKETLIELWMAEGFITPINENQDLEEVGEEYFMMLLQRCFFQDINKDDYGNIISCKMHDIMHDLALGVAGSETKIAKIEDSMFTEKTHHMSLAYRVRSTWSVPTCMSEMKHLRTILLPQQVNDGSTIKAAVLEQIISNFKCLRVLDLHAIGLEILPKSVGKLIHLRYLDLSDNPIKILPHSITKLYNLQTLNLHNCAWLRALPINIGNLTNLRSLDLRDCYLLSLTHMPPGIGELTSLHKLTFFTVKVSSDLKDLKTLNNLRGSLQIKIRGEVIDNANEVEEANLTRKHGLTKLHLAGGRQSYFNTTGRTRDEAILEGLKPHPNLRELEIYWYAGQKLRPSWAMADSLLTTLPKLVKITLLQCRNCQCLPSFSQLPLLRVLQLKYLENVEYIESGLCALQSTSQSMTTFFPALQELTLKYMGKLKGWLKAREDISGDDQQETQHQSGLPCLQSLSFPNLAKLKIQYCPNLASFPLCPNVEELTSLKVNEKLCLLKTLTSSAMRPSVSSSTMLPTFTSNLKTLGVDNVEDLISLPEENLNHLSELHVEDGELQSMSRLMDVCKSLSTLNRLELYNCRELKSISEGLEHLTALEELVLWDCGKLDLSCNGQLEEGMPWKALNRLRYLKIQVIPKLVNLPSGLQNLTNLRTLEINCCWNLKELPEWISCLSSLEIIELRDCLKLNPLPESLKSFRV